MNSMRPDPLRDQEYFSRTTPRPSGRWFSRSLKWIIAAGWLILMAVEVYKRLR